MLTITTIQDAAHGMNDGADAILVRTPDAAALDTRTMRKRAVEMAQAIGWPQRPSPSGEIAWPVAPRGGTLITQRAGAADLHTDSVYRERPEEFVVLAMLTPAFDGGTSLLFSRDALVARLRGSKMGREAYDLLTATDMPIAVPAEFQIPGQPTVILGRVFEEAGLRWRSDLIAQGLQAFHGLDTPKVRECLHTVEAVIQGAVADGDITSVQLRPGDMLVIANRHCLHGRTHFTDLRRQLVRVRCDSQASVSASYGLARHRE